MAHIPQDAAYVHPPTSREVDEDAITEDARYRLMCYGFCPDCRAGVMPEASDDEYEAWADAHAASCDLLRERVLDRMEADRD